MKKETPVDWTETSTPDLFNGKRPQIPISKSNRCENKLHYTWYRLQHVYKQMQDNSMDELQFEKILVPNLASALLNEARKME